MLKLSRLLAILAILVLATIARAGDDKDNWYVVEAFGQHVGWMHTTVATKDDTITTTTKMQFGFSAAPPRSRSQWRAPSSKPNPVSPSP